MDYSDDADDNTVTVQGDFYTANIMGPSVRGPGPVQQKTTITLRKNFKHPTGRKLLPWIVANEVMYLAKMSQVPLKLSSTDLAFHIHSAEF